MGQITDTDDQIRLIQSNECGRADCHEEILMFKITKVVASSNQNIKELKIGYCSQHGYG